ncbi:MAG: isoprenylcysteine carboxylmethyltransferase family protein [Planctomycetes bacterium]|nr:isoprenylcysteine carboxylmethyltransferase family protein [Planctomycetota bacterium]
MRTLELKVPPLVVLLLTGGLMWLGSRAFPHLGASYPGRPVVAGLLAGIGAVVIILGVVSFRLARTTLNPMKPDATTSLVVSGVYRMTRNPIYLGLLLVLLGGAAFLSNAAAVPLLPLFVLYLNRFQIRPEEKALDARFGREFAAYKARVRRWI